MKGYLLSLVLFSLTSPAKEALPNVLLDPEVLNANIERMEKERWAVQNVPNGLPVEESHMKCHIMLNGYRIGHASRHRCSPYGYRKHPILKDVRKHQGIDITAPMGVPIIATQDGTVVVSEYKKHGYGHYIVIRGKESPYDGSQYQTLYGHCTKLFVKEGATVTKGDTIASVGSTGLSTGYHVHFEVHKKNSNGTFKSVDPKTYLSTLVLN